MAMLAEPRRRQKLSSDPRGLNWANDDSKFGQKLMEKMGWKSGKGLGANEDGMKEHIKVDVKNDARGVGCSKSYVDNWIAHQDDFNSLLSSLNSGAETNESDKNKVQSLEKKSKESKGRVHYQKFTRGKDLSAVKGQDLDSIFGRRKSAPSTPQTQSEENSSAESSSDEGGTKTDTSHGVTTISTGTSVSEYFAKKMAEIKAKAAGISTGNSGISTGNSSPNESEIVPSSFSGQVDGVQDTDEDRQASKDKKRKRKKEKKAKEMTSVPSEDISCEKVKTKKKKKSKEIADVEASEDGVGDNELGDDIQMKDFCNDIIKDSVNDSLSSKKKKKKKSKKYSDDAANETVSEDIAADMILEKQGSVKRKRKKDKSNNDNISNQSDIESEKSEVISKTKTKKKDKVQAANILNEDKVIKYETELVSDEKKTKKRTKKQKDKKNKKQKMDSDLKSPQTVKKDGTSGKINPIATAFPGANLASIAGYGGGGDIGYSQSKKGKKR